MSRAFYAVLAAAVLTGAAVFGVAAWLRKTTPEESIYVPKKEVITPEIKLLQQYVRLQSVNPPGDVTAAASFVAGLLRQNGLQPETITTGPGRANVYMRLKGNRPGRALLLLHHMDVVPAPDPQAWESPPFEAKISRNQLWGRGSLDMKGIGLCHLLAFVEAARNPAREHDLIFLATADEETGSEFGLVWLLEHRPDIFEGVTYVLNEGGITEMRQEKLTYFAVEVGSKQFVRILLRASSREPLQRARIALEPLFTPRDPERILPEVREYFRRLAPHRYESAEMLRDIDKSISEGKFWRLHPSYRVLTQNNVLAFGIKEEEGGCSLEAYLQNLPDEDPAAAIARFKRRVSPFGVRVEVLQTMGPTRISSTQTAFFKLISDSVRAEFGPADVGPYISPYATTDCRYLRERGMECYGLFPFPVDVEQSMGIHSVNERVRLDWFRSGISVTRNLVRAYLSPG